MFVSLLIAEKREFLRKIILFEIQPKEIIPLN